MLLAKIDRRALALLFIITALELLAVSLFHRVRAHSEEAAVLLAQMQAIVNRLDALEWRAMPQDRLPPAIAQEVAELRGRMDTNMMALARLAEDHLKADSIKRPYDLYVAAVDRQFAHLQRGERERALWHGERRVDPAFKRLQEALQTSERLGEVYAAGFGRWDSWGTLVAITAASGVIVLLLSYVLSAQARAVKAEASQHLLEESERSAAEIRRLNESLELRVAQRTDELRVANENLQREMAEKGRLQGMLQQASEQEKLRLGQDLHDGLGQLLTGAAMRSKALEHQLRSHSMLQAEDLSRLTGLVAEALRMARNLAGMLYPIELEKEGLVPALQALAVRLSTQFGMPCVLEVRGHIPTTAVDKAIHLYRIAQEAATNAIRHGMPSQVHIRLAQVNAQMTLEVENDGPPIQRSAGTFDGMGCRIMKHRASLLGGTLSTIALDTGGCRVACSWPAPA